MSEPDNAQQMLKDNRQHATMRNPKRKKKTDSSWTEKGAFLCWIWGWVYPESASLSTAPSAPPILSQIQGRTSSPP
eukprot:2864905-Rhodomonas_salina.1